MAETVCRHCGQRIVCVNYLTGPAWTHQPAGASFQDGAHIYCHTTTAKPRPVGRRGLDAAEAEVEAATHLYGVAVVRADAAEAKLTAVRALHQRVGIYEDADQCNCLEKTTHNVGYTEDGDEICLDSPCPDEGYRCAECVDEWGEPVPYPCPTIIALNGDPDE